jgi:MFS family permease
MVIYCVGNLIETFSSGSIPALYVGRLIAGFGIGSLTVIGPMAIVEIAPAATRGLLALWFNIAMLSSQMLGIFVVYGCKVHILSAKDLQYQVPFFVQCFVPVIGIIMSLFLHESPRWLCIQGRNDEALQTLTKIRGLESDHPYLVSEWSRMSEQVSAENTEFQGDNKYVSIIKETFLVPSNFRRVQLTIIAYVLAQFSGANSITNYLPSILKLIGVSSTDQQVYGSGLYAMDKLICCIFASLFFVDVIGRRKSLFTGITVQILSLTYLAGFLYYFLQKGNHVPKAASDMAIASIYIHAFGWGVGK